MGPHGLAMYLRRAFQKHPTSADFKSTQTRQLSDAIYEYGQMVKRHYSRGSATVEVAELASRFRETPQIINDALVLLRDEGRAEEADLDGCWILR
jgi:hypothetical protein